MFDFRSPMIWGPPVAGLTAGAFLWLLIGGPSASNRTLEPLLRGQARPAATGEQQSASATALNLLASRPIFASRAAAPRITLVGISRTPGRIAALLAIGDEEPRWIGLGETTAGMTLVSVKTTGVSVDRLEGSLTIPLGETVDGATQAIAGGAAEEDIPPGVRLPREPANAPAP